MKELWKCLICFILNTNTQRLVKMLNFIKMIRSLRWKVRYSWKHQKNAAILLSCPWVRSDIEYKNKSVCIQFPCRKPYWTSKKNLKLHVFFPDFFMAVLLLLQMCFHGFINYSLFCSRFTLVVINSLTAVTGNLYFSSLVFYLF